MRLLIIGCVLAFVIYKFVGKFGPAVAENGAAGFFSAFGRPEKQVAPAGSNHGAGAGTSVLPAKPVSPDESRAGRSNGSHVLLLGSYEFRNRDAPEMQWPQGSDSSFLVRSGKVWVWRLPAEDAVAVSALAKSLDRQGKTYVAESVAVAIGTAKGYDVSVEAFLRAVADLSPTVKTAKLADGVLSLSATRSNLLAALDIEAGKEHLTTITAPVGLLQDGKNLVVESGIQVPIPQIATDERSTRAGVEYRKIGFRFEVRLQELTDGLSLDIKQTAGRIGRTVRIEGNDVPQFEEESLVTTLGLEPGQWYLVGGLKTDTKSGNWSISRLSKKWESANIYLLIRILKL